MSEFAIRIKVRHYELDTLGHLNHAVYHSYGEVARLEWFESVGSGGKGQALVSAKLAPVLLESHIRYKRELLAGDEVDVTCEVSFNDGESGDDSASGKVYRMDSKIRKLDGTVAAEIECTFGVMDLRTRKLVEDPREQFRAAGLRV